MRFHQSPARKNAAFTLTPNTADAFVYQDEYVNFLNVTYPAAFGHATTPIFLSLDNEPDLWQHTHARLRGDGNVNTQAGQNATYAEIVQRSIDYADAAKDVNPSALIFGPVNYGWQGMIRFQDAADHMNRDFLEFYLAQMAAAQVTDGRRLLDVLDVHWYPEARGACVAIRWTAAVSPKRTPTRPWSTRASRRRAASGIRRTPRRSWITGCCSGGPIRLLPRLKDKIAANYPNTLLAITEYNYGAANHISGAIAQADVLGIFGREGLFAANLWRLVSEQQLHLRRVRDLPQLRWRQWQLRRHQHSRDQHGCGQCVGVRQRQRRRRGTHGDRGHQQVRLGADRGNCRHSHRAVPHRAGVHADQRQLRRRSVRPT